MLDRYPTSSGKQRAIAASVLDPLWPGRMPHPMDSRLAPTAPAGLAGAPPRPGLVDGARALFSGIGFIVTTPEIWPLAMVPIVIGSVLSVALWVPAIKFIPPLFTAWLGATHGTLAMI